MISLKAETQSNIYSLNSCRQNYDPMPTFGSRQNTNIVDPDHMLETWSVSGLSSGLKNKAFKKQRRLELNLSSVEGFKDDN